MAPINAPDQWLIKMMQNIVRPLAWTFAGVLMSACTSFPTSEEYENDVAYFGDPEVANEVYDARGEFRRVFCAVARGAERADDVDNNCDDYLWRLEDETATATAPIADLPPLDRSLRVFIVGGAFSDCFGDASVAFGKGVVRLSAEGARISHVPTSGRSSAYFNASRIAEHYAQSDTTDDEFVVLIGYSKGTVDILHFLARYPATSQTVDAVISVSGPVHGSEIARRGAWMYDALLANNLSGMCEPGDGGVCDSLVPEYQQTWLSEHEPPEHVRYYTLSAFTTREHMARGLVPSYRMLAGADPRNDGQVAVEEGLLPGSVLLGYANADHWSLAIDIEDALGFIAARPSERRFPREVLFEALLRFVSEDVSRPQRATSR